MQDQFSKAFNGIMKFIEKYYLIFLFILSLLAVFNLFYNLGNDPIKSWDEARHGVSAYEMMKNKNYIANTYAYKYDYWNLKPPISFWAIIAGFKLFGLNPLGLRFFSAVAALITILITAIFVNKRHGKIASLISALVLITTYQYISIHSARTGDADSLYIMFFTASMLSMILCERNIIWLYFAGLFFSFTFLTKSWHALNIVIIGGLYLLTTGKLFKLKVKEWCIFILCSFMPIIIWIALRYQYDGIVFFKNMISFDLLARASTTLEGHTGGKTFYFEVINSNFIYWILLLVGGLIAYLTTYESITEKQNRNYIYGIILWIIVPFLMYTKSKTKIAWYILPLYPPLAICIGAFISRLMKIKASILPLQAVLSLLIIFAAYKNERMIFQDIAYKKTDLTQQILMDLKSDNKSEYSNIYTLYGNKNNPFDWEQCYLLAAELYGDLIPQEGGIQGFMQDKDCNSILLIPKEFLTEAACSTESKSLSIESFIENNNLEIIMENSSNYILKKQNTFDRVKRCY